VEAGNKGGGEMDKISGGRRQAESLSEVSSTNNPHF